MFSACRTSGPTPPEDRHIDNSAEYTESTTVDASPAFELFNIAIALTDSGMESGHYVDKSTPYYAEVRTAFDGMKSHPFVKLIGDFCRQNPAQ